MNLRTPQPRSIFLLGTRVDNIDECTALRMAIGFAAHRDGLPARTVCFTNVHTICEARRDRTLMHCVNLADLVLPDGSGLKIAGRIFGTPIRENLNGTDFTPKVLDAAQQNGLSVYLLGAQLGRVVSCRANLLRQYPNLKIVGLHHGYFTADDEQDVIRDINAKKPDILLVALGTPRQEKWISKNARCLNVGVCLAVGGLFDFLSGTIERAPAWMRRAGIEWIFRLLQEPRLKWKRVFLEIPMFLALVIAKRIVPRKLRMLHDRRVALR